MTKRTTAELRKLLDYVTGQSDTYTVVVPNDSDQDASVTLGAFEQYAEVSESDYASESAYEAAEALQEEGDALAEAVDNQGEDVVRAALVVIDGYATGSVIAADDIERFLANNYKGRYDTAGDFARQEAHDFTNSPEETQWLDSWRPFIDWKAKATELAKTDYALVSLDEEKEKTETPPSGEVFVFDSDLAL